MSHRLQAFALLRDLGVEDCEQLEDLLEEREVPEGSPLFRARDEAEGMVLLLEGEVSLEAPDGQPVGSLADGEVLGAMSLAAIGARECSARAVKPSRVLCMSRESYLRLRLDRPSLALELQESVVRELAASLRVALKP